MALLQSGILTKYDAFFWPGLMSMQADPESGCDHVWHSSVASFSRLQCLAASILFQGWSMQIFVVVFAHDSMVRSLVPEQICAMAATAGLLAGGVLQ